MTGITSQLSTALADRYRIESHLGEGGMATVYLAQDVKHDRKVALKVLRPELAAVIGAERFLNEIKVTANLQHPHILPLHDSGEAGSFLFYVMPYVEGDTLRDKLNREKQLDITEAIEISRSVASALDYAHRQGVIHRDIKPENVLIHDGQALVADFGIALAVSEASGKRLTETGLSIGTPHYMSPEQAMGDRELDARSDIYSVGAMLFEMLAGEPPYQGSSAQAVVAKVITEKAPPVTVARDTVPPHVAAAVAKALQKMPADRFKTAAAFADALTNTAFSIPSTAVRTGMEPAAPAARSNRSVAMIGGGVAVAAIAAFLVGRMTVPEPEQPVSRFVVPPPEGVTGYSACCGPQQALSPDGEWLVFRGGGGAEGRAPLYRRRLGRLEAEVVPGTDGGLIPFFSPDGTWLGFLSDGGLRKVPMTGGPPVPIASVARADGASWGDNDLIVFARGSEGLYTVPAAGGEPIHVPGTEALGPIHPAMLPGGTAAVARIGAGEARMVVIDLTTGATDTLGFGTRVAYASGYLLFSGSDGTLLAQPFDPKARRTTGPSVAILDGVRLAGPSVGEFAVSQNGAIAYQFGGEAGATEALRLSGSSGASAVPLPQRGNLEDPAFSPDGRRIALRYAGTGQNQDIWIFDRDQGTLFRFTVDGDYNGAPVWTKDGSRIAFESTRDGGAPQLYWKPSDGSGTPERLLVSEDYRALPGSWFPDGKTLAIVRQQGGNFDIGFLTVGDSAPRWFVQSEFNERHAQVSPDGRWLAYSSDRSGRYEVYVEATSGDGGRYQVSTTGGEAPRWNPDGRILYYADAGAGYVITAATVSTDRGFRVTSRAARSEILTDRNGNVPNYDIHPESDEILIIDQSGGAQGIRGMVWIQNWPRIIREMTAR